MRFDPSLLLPVLIAATPLAAQQVKPYGCGVNPAGSLTVAASTSPTIGTTMGFMIHNPLGTQGTNTFTALLVDGAPSTKFPCGAKLPGWGMASPGAPGEFLVSPQFQMLRGPVWSGKPVRVNVRVPPLVSFIGEKVYAQAVMYDPFSPIGFALTNALELTVGPSPRSLAFGSSFGSTINPKGEFEVFEFTGRKGDQLVIPYARTTGSGFSVRVELYDVAWKLLGSSESINAEFRPNPLPAAGKYHLVVRTRSGVTGSYHLSLRRTVDPAVSKSIAMGDSFGASISGTWTEVDVYELVGRAGDQLTIPFARTTGSGFSLRLDLYDAAGRRLASKASTSAVFSPPPLPSSGRYFLWVYNPGRNVTGSYHLTLQRTVDPGRPIVKKIGDSFGGSIHPTWTEIDVYQISAKAGDELFLPYARTTGSGFSLRLDLYDSTGVLLGSSASTSAIFQPKKLPTTGTYYLWVYNPARNVTGSYHLTLQRISRSATVGSIVPGRGKVYGSISPTWTEVDIYQLTALAGLKMMATYARTTGSGFSVYAELRDANGLVITKGSSGSLPINVPATDTYYLWIRNPARNVTGKYWVEVK